jgi:hypothetical protein
VRVGLALARGEWVVVQDADLEYRPSDIVELLAVAEREGCDAVLGSRLLGRKPAVPWHHALGRDLLNLLFRLLYGARLTDVATCYKLLRTSLAQQLCLESVGFDLDYELPCKLRRAGVRLVEAPVWYEPRTIAAGKKLRWTDGLVALRALLRPRFRREPGGLPVGQRVRVTDGPFTGAEGTVADASGPGVAVGFVWAGREVVVRCPAENVATPLRSGPPDARLRAV